jgi:hypothetical protein
MKNHLLMLFLLLTVVGCGVESDAPLDTNAALTDADFDGWRASDSHAPSGEARPNHSDANAAPDAQGSFVNGIVDRVIAHVDSVDAKVHFKQTNGTWTASSVVEPQTRVETTPKSTESARPSSRSQTQFKPNLVPTTNTKNPPPPPAPPAEPLALSQGQATTVETLDIPNGWTGAAVYHAAKCQHCPALLAALRSRATKVSGNYLLVDGCWFLLVDWEERPDVDRPKIPGLPAVLYFVDGRERLKDRVIGFGNRPGELEMIIRRHPHYGNRSQVRANLSEGAAYSGPVAIANCPCGPACGCLPGSQCGCLSGTTTASPLWYELPARGVTNSAGVNLFGMPIISGSIGTYPTSAP